MGNYKHLKEKDRKKLITLKKTNKFMFRVTGWGLLILLIIICLVVGIVAFYISIDNKYGYSESQGELSSYAKNKDEDKSLDVYFEKDLENAVEGRKNNEENSNPNKKHEPNNDINKKDTELQSDLKLDKTLDFADWNKKCPMELRIINSRNPLSEDYNAETKLCRGKEVNLMIVEPLETMIEDARKQGIVLWISSGYRSIKYQTKLFNNQVKQEISNGKSPEEAKKTVSKVLAEPGKSEHNAGLAVDFNGVSDDFYKTREYKWLMDHAHEYGFIERYQEKWYEETGVLYEPWHFRYVGEHSKNIKESNLSLEGYINQKLR